MMRRKTDVSTGDEEGEGLAKNKQTRIFMVHTQTSTDSDSR